MSFECDVTPSNADAGITMSRIRVQSLETFQGLTDEFRTTLEDPPEEDEAQLQLFHVLYIVIRFVIVNVERQDTTSAPQRRLVFVRDLVTHWELTGCRRLLDLLAYAYLLTKPSTLHRLFEAEDLDSSLVDLASRLRAPLPHSVELVCVGSLPAFWKACHWQKDCFCLLVQVHHYVAPLWLSVVLLGFMFLSVQHPRALQSLWSC